jgi:hypothetical protein
VFLGPVTNNYIAHAWDSKERLVVSLDLLRTAFRENELLREYCTLPEKNRLEPVFINTYVLEALMAVIRQAHRSPGCQNIRADPGRADQVQVLARKGGERWEILTLVEAVRLLFRDAAGHMEHLASSGDAQRELTQAERTASFLMPQAYRQHPEKYEREGKNRLAAHLATLRIYPAPRDGCGADTSGLAGPATLGSGFDTKHRAAGLVPPPEGASPEAGSPIAGPEPSAGALWPEMVSGPPTVPRVSPFDQPRPALRHPPPFSPTAAAALLREHPLVLDDLDRAPGGALQRLSELSGQDPSRIINHLWDAKEEGLLTAEEETWAAALTRQFDGVD